MHFGADGSLAMGMIWWTFYSAKVSALTQNMPKFYSADNTGVYGASGSFWEFYELMVDEAYYKNNYISLLQQGGLLDTLKDLLVDPLGSGGSVEIFMKEKITTRY